MKLIAVYSLFIIFPFFVYAQKPGSAANKVNVDTIDIKEMVKAQIEKIKTKEHTAIEKIKEAAEINTVSRINNASENKPVSQFKEDTVKTIAENKSSIKEAAHDTAANIPARSFSAGTYSKIAVLAAACLVAAGIIIIRRRKLKTINSESDSKLKKNVKQLRDDKVDIKNDEKLVNIRKNLQSVAKNNKYDEESLSSHAKQLSVSKGELSLAARLKSFYRIKNARTNK